RNLALAGMLGLFGGIGLCFLVDYLDRSIKTKEDVERLLGLSVLGFVPPVEDEHDDGLPLETSPLRDPRSPLAEAFRQVRTGVSVGVPSSGPGAMRALVVTSTLPGDGKTTVSVNLAIALAQLGKRVLLVDADLRKGRLHPIFGIANERGLADLLAGEQPLSALGELAVAAPEVENLSVLPRGPSPPNPADLLNG